MRTFSMINLLMMISKRSQNITFYDENFCFVIDKW